MKQICRFNTKPRTVNEGGFKKGRHLIWLNLGVSEITELSEDIAERWQSTTQRLSLADLSLRALLQAIDPLHLACADNLELNDILRYFNAEDDIDSWKAIRKVQIQGYDQSSAVNSFMLGSESMWLDKATRVGLVNSITIEKNAGRETTVLWYGHTGLQLNVDDALSMLSRLELYALECYNVTARHLAAIEETESIEALREFDVSADYPNRPEFQIAD